jgi:hypothetical protein
MVTRYVATVTAFGVELRTDGTAEAQRPPSLIAREGRRFEAQNIRNES